MTILENLTWFLNSEDLSVCFIYCLKHLPMYKCIDIFLHKWTHTPTCAHSHRTPQLDSTMSDIYKQVDAFACAVWQKGQYYKLNLIFPQIITCFNYHYILKLHLWFWLLKIFCLSCPIIFKFSMELQIARISICTLTHSSVIF